MAQMDLQIDQKPARSRNGQQDYRLIQQPRPRGIVAQVVTLLLQPGVFFRTLPALVNSRQWLLIAAIILTISGMVAVRQSELAAEADSTGGSDMMPPPDMLDPRMGGGAVSGDLGGMPPDMGMSMDGGMPGGPALASTGGVSTTWTTALVAGGSLLAAWLLQALLLSEVSLFNGRAPRLGLNLQIAVYASVPLALITGLLALYYNAGGAMGEPGLTGLATEWSGFAGQTPFIQALLVSLSSRLTLFWLWSLLLLYLGARHALRGRWWASALVVAAWVAVIVVTPVLTGAVTAPPTEDAILPGEMPDIDGGLELPMEGRPDMSGREMPPAEGDAAGPEGFEMEGAAEEAPGDVNQPALEAGDAGGEGALIAEDDGAAETETLGPVSAS